MVSYLRAVAANRYTLAGGVLVGGTLGAQGMHLLHDGKLSNMLLFTGCVLFGLTKGGIETYRAMQDAEQELAETGELDRKFQKCHARTFCEAVGVRSVARQSGLEEQLTSETVRRADPLTAARRYGPVFVANALLCYLLM